MRRRQDVDEVAVLRVLAGDRTLRLNIAEREEAVRRLSARGISATRTAAALNVSERTVWYVRARLRTTP